MRVDVTTVSGVLVVHRNVFAKMEQHATLRMVHVNVRQDFRVNSALIDVKRLAHSEQHWFYVLLFLNFISKNSRMLCYARPFLKANYTKNY